MRREELVEFIIQERVESFYEERRKSHPELLEEGRRRLDEWEQSIASCSPEIQAGNRNYLNWLAEQQGMEVEEVYQLGLEDGIRLAKRIRELMR